MASRHCQCFGFPRVGLDWDQDQPQPTYNIDRDRERLDQLVHEARYEPTARIFLAEYWKTVGRFDIAYLWEGPLSLPYGTRDRIEELTKTEQRRLKSWANKCIKFGLSTEPADRDLFTAAIHALYLTANLVPPEIYWVGNPIQEGWNAVGGTVRGAVWDAVGGAVWAAIWDMVGGAVENAVEGVVRNEVNVVGDAVGGMVRNAVGDAVRGAVRNEVNAVRNEVNAVRNAVWGAVWGQFEIHVPAYYLAFIKILKLRIDPILEYRLRAWFATCASACWWYPGRDRVLVSERPYRLEQTPKLIIEWEGFKVER